MVLVSIAMIIFIGAIAALGLIYIKNYMPTKERIPLRECYPIYTDSGAAVILDGKYIPGREDTDNAIVSDGVVYLERNFLKENLDDRYVFDDTEKIIRYTTNKKIYQASYDGSSYSAGGTKKDIKCPVTISENDTVYTAVPFIRALTDFRYKVSGKQSKSNPRRIAIFTAGFEYEKAVFKRQTAVRINGGPKSRIMTDSSRGDSLFVIQDHDRWAKVLTDTGVLGYVRKNVIKDRTEKQVSARLKKRKYTHNLMDGRIILGWHQVTTQAANSGLSRVVSGTKINVISPTWYYLNDSVGGIASHASSDYIKTAHSKGIKVWGLVSNFENPYVDTEVVLNTTSRRDTLIKNLIWSAVSVGLDGINIDFEEVPSSAADGYIEFIREMSLKCKANNLVLSVDNYVPESYNSYYNYSEQGLYADYCVMMGYDEYYSGSDSAGPTASLPYIQNGLKKLLEEVKPNQVILGMPFYSRLWKTANGDLSSKAMSMKSMAEYISSHGLTEQWLSDMSLNYVEGTVDGSSVQMWVEDAKSLNKKLELMNKNELAGCAFWKLGFEPASIWSVISDYDN